MESKEGKPLWKLLNNLPNHGVGRLVLRLSWKQDPKAPTYMRILEVDMNSKTFSMKRLRKFGEKERVTKIPVKVERVVRGIILPRAYTITRVSYFEDFVLIPREEEDKFLSNARKVNLGETDVEEEPLRWNKTQRRRVKELVAGGMALEEAERREKERVYHERAKNRLYHKERNTAIVSRVEETNAGDYYDLVDEEQTSGSFAFNNCADHKKESESQNTEKNKTSLKMGKKTRGPSYRGKPLYQLLENLPNHGVGRIIIRGSFKQEEEVPSFMRILEVDMSSKMVQKRKGKKSDKIRIPVKVEKVWRGVIFPQPVNITSTSHLSDFILVDESEEERFIKNAKTANQVGPAYWNAVKKRQISTLRAIDAKQKQKEKIARCEVEQTEREDREPNATSLMQTDETSFGDNFEDDELAKASGSVHSNYCAEEKRLSEKKNTGTYQPSGNQQKSRNIKYNQYNVQRQSGLHKPLQQHQFHKKFQSKETMQEDFGEFSEQQKERIERMVKNGMNPDTAKQLEWERQTALEAGAHFE